MSDVGFRAYNADGSAIFDSTRNVWSLVATSYVRELERKIIELDPVLVNSTLEVRMIRWAGQPPMDYGSGNYPVYRVTDSAFNRIFSTINNLTNVAVVRLQAKGALTLYTVNYNAFETDIANKSLLAYLIINTGVMSIVDRYVSYQGPALRGGGSTWCLVTNSLLQTHGTDIAYFMDSAMFNSNLGSAFTTNNVWDIPRNQGPVPSSSLSVCWTGTRSHNQEVMRNFVRDKINEVINSYEINDELLSNPSVYSVPVGGTSITYNSPPTYSIENNNIIINPNGTVPVYVEVYAK
jgi:hypothetical protein